MKIMNRAHATREAWHPQTKQDRDAILRELEEILASPHFCNSKRYPTLLQYIVENTLAGKLELLKERTLGVEVFDRPPTYDTNTDTVVRYTAGEVRKRLLLYYSEHGSISGIRISLPAGSYVAEFLHGTRHEEPGEDHGYSRNLFCTTRKLSGPAYAIRTSSMPGLCAGRGGGSAVSGSRFGFAVRAADPVQPVLWPALIAVSFGAAGLGSGGSIAPADPQTAVDVFWSPVMRDQRALIICTGSSVFAPQNYSGVETAGKDIDYTFVSMQIASGIAQISNAMGHSGAATELAPSATTSLPDLREHSVTLLGGYNNQWTLRLLRPLRFHFVEDSGHGEIIVDADAAQNALGARQLASIFERRRLCAVARFRDPTIDGWVMVLAGLGPQWNRGRRAIRNQSSLHATAEGSRGKRFCQPEYRGRS